jgi:hypothetical protein
MGRVVNFIVFDLHIFSKFQASHAVSSVTFVTRVTLALNDRILGSELRLVVTVLVGPRVTV